MLNNVVDDDITLTENDIGALNISKLDKNLTTLLLSSILYCKYASVV